MKRFDYPFFLARRMSLRSKGKKRAPAVGVAIAAIALSVAVMALSIAIVTGFKREIRSRITGFNSHVTLMPLPTDVDNDNVVKMTPSLAEELSSIPYVESSALQAAIPAILKTPDDFKGVYLRTLNSPETSAFLKSNIEEGDTVDFSLKDNHNKILVSRSVARELRLKAGDKTEAYFLSDDLRVRKLEIAGVFNSHFEQFDDVIIYGALPLVQKLGGLEGNEGTFIQIFTDNFDKTEEYSADIRNRLNRAYSEGRIPIPFHVENIRTQGAGYFAWLELLDMNVLVILVLMAAIACITLVSGMLIIILEKKRFIGIMKAIGTPTTEIRRVFVYMAMRIAFTGLIIGNTLAAGIICLQRATHFLKLDPESYYIDFVPAEISFSGFALLNAGVLAVVYFVLILPSRIVAGISPAETMRYE